MSVQILTDSTSDILPEEAEQKGVRVVPLLVNFGEEAFRENVEITHQEYFRRLAQAESLPTTSQPTPQDFLAHFEQVRDAGDSLVCVLLASKLSGTFQSAQLAKELSGYDEIYIVDSQQALCGLRMLVDFACVLRDEGLSAREIAEQVESASHRVRLFGIVNTLEYLHKGGRLPASMAVVGTLLKVKPLITLREGEVGILGNFGVINIEEACDAVNDSSHISNGKLHGSLCDDMAGDEIHPEPRLPLYFGYTQTHNLCDQLRERVVEKYHPARVEQNSVGAVVGTHVGPDGAVVVYLDQE